MMQFTVSISTWNYRLFQMFASDSVICLSMTVTYVCDNSDRIVDKNLIMHTSLGKSMARNKSDCSRHYQISCCNTAYELNALVKRTSTYSTDAFFRANKIVKGKHKHKGWLRSTQSQALYTSRLSSIGHLFLMFRAIQHTWMEASYSEPIQRDLGLFMKFVHKNVQCVKK